MINSTEFVQRYEKVKDIFAVRCVNPDLVDIYQRVGIVQAIAGECSSVYINDSTHEVDNSDLMWEFDIDSLRVVLTGQQPGGGEDE